MQKHTENNHVSVRSRVELKKRGSDNRTEMSRVEIYAAFYKDEPGRCYISIDAGAPESGGTLSFYPSLAGLQTCIDVLTEAIALIEAGDQPAAETPPPDVVPIA
jgi:hypothetical protein